MLKMGFCGRDCSERRDPGHRILVARISKRIKDLKSGSKWTDQKRHRKESLSLDTMESSPYKNQYVLKNIEALSELFP